MAEIQGTQAKISRISNDNKKWDVIALGNVAVDDLLYVPAYPPPDSKVRVTHSERQCGGLMATALVAASRLGARCVYAGSLGDDELSRFVEATLLRESIDVTFIARSEHAAPTHSRIIVDTSTGTRNIFYEVKKQSGADPLRPREDVIKAARVLLVDPWGEAGTLRAARIAREAGVAIVSDIERDNFATFRELFALVDHLIIPVDFALKLTGWSTPEDAARALWNEERTVVVVTCGDRGGVAVSREYSDLELRRYQAFQVNVVDTTGCGDVFHGAYAAGLAQGLGLDERLRLAAATAAIKATQKGGQSGIPSRAEADDFLLRASQDQVIA